jgi:TatD DNase family protein
VDPIPVPPPTVQTPPRRKPLKSSPRKDRVQASSPSKTTGFKPREESSSKRPPRRDDRAQKVQVKEGKHERLPGASCSKEVERRVQIAEGTSTDPASRKRKSVGEMENLIITKDVLKKSKTDEILLKVHQRTEERREKKKERRLERRCWIPGCTELNVYKKAHAFHHIPSIFDERLEPTDERVLRGRRNALKQATRWLLGRPAELDELVAFLIVQKVLCVTDNTDITPRQDAAMREMCTFLKEPVPDKFTLEPCNSPGALIHWKAVLLIAASLTGEERQYWQETFQAPEELLEAVAAVAVQQEKVYPEAFDSHFHLDRTRRDLQLPNRTGLDEVLATVPVDPDKKITLKGAVAIYCDPRTYPTEQDLLDLPSHVSVGLGFHPKHASYSVSRIDDEVRQFRRLLRNPRVVAFGEVGLDHSEPMKHWAYQAELLEKVLPLLEDRHVLVLHCRGMQGDCGTEAFLLLLHLLKKHVRPQTAIHLHCFTGNQYVVKRWLEEYPRTYFGFTNKVRSFNPGQVEALCSIDESRLLLESDAPYFPPKGSKVSTPAQLYHAAEVIATHRNLSAERVLEITLANGQHLYQGQQ